MNSVKLIVSMTVLLLLSSLNKLLSTYELNSIKDNARNDFMKLVDVNKKRLISLAYLKQVLDLPRIQFSGEDAHFGLDFKPMKDSFKDKEDIEIENNARKALKRIWQNCNLIDLLRKQLKLYDTDKDQVMSRVVLKQSINEIAKDAHEDDINYIVQYADKKNKGYFSPDFFLDNLTQIAQEESKNDAILRRLGNVVKHKGLDFEKELLLASKNNSGTINIEDFIKSLRDLRLGIDANDMEDLTQIASNGGASINIKQFLRKIDDAINNKFAIIIPQKPKKSEAEKKKSESNEQEHKKTTIKLQNLATQLLNAKKDLEKVEKNAIEWKTIAEKNEKALNILSDKLIDPSDKLKKVGEIEDTNNATKLLKQQLRQQQKILELTDKLNEICQRNEELEKKVQVDAQSKLSSHESEIRITNDKLASLQSENIFLQNQVDKIANSASSYERDEEAEYTRQMNIKNYEAKIKDAENVEKSLRDELLKLEHLNLELKFEKENNSLKISKLKDKIYELEHYIQMFNKLAPSVVSKVASSSELNIEKEMIERPGTSKRSAAELEKVIEGLKRIITNQKSELESVRKKESKFKAVQDKIPSNKQMKDEINSLENELRTLGDKNAKIEELEYKSQKLTEVNKSLLNDVLNEQKRYEFLESKYKELLIKYNIASKDLEKKEESLFSMSTGANRATYQEYLAQKETQNKDYYETK